MAKTQAVEIGQVNEPYFQLLKSQTPNGTVREVVSRALSIFRIVVEHHVKGYNIVLHHPDTDEFKKINMDIPEEC